MIDSELGTILESGLIECKFCCSTFENEKEFAKHLNDNGFIYEYEDGG